MNTIPNSCGAARHIARPKAVVDQHFKKAFFDAFVQSSEKTIDGRLKRLGHCVFEHRGLGGLEILTMNSP